MTPYNSLNVKLSDSQLNKLKPAINNETEVILRLSSNMIGNSDDETNFPHKLLLTNEKVANLHKAFVNVLSADIMLSNIQLSKIVQSGGFLGRLFAPLLKGGLPLMKSVLQPLGEGVVILLGLTTAAPATDAGIHKKILGSRTRTLVISNKEMKDILKIVRSLEDSGLLLKGVSETIQNEGKEQKGGFLGMLIGTLGARLWGNMLAGKGINTAGDGIFRAGYGSKGSSIKRSSENKKN